MNCVPLTTLRYVKVLLYQNFLRGFILQETLHVQSFVKIKSLRNVVIAKYLCPLLIKLIFDVTKESLLAIWENKILAKIFEYMYTEQAYLHKPLSAYQPNVI